MGRCLFCVSEQRAVLFKRGRERRFAQDSPQRRFASFASLLGWCKLTVPGREPRQYFYCEKEMAVLMKGQNEGMSEDKKTPLDSISPASAQSEEDAHNLAPDDIKTLDEMMPLVYEELRLLAGGYLRHERPEHTLQRTALVHEAYLRLAAQDKAAWENPAHFLAIFARLMRQTLTNHAVARTRNKRGGAHPTDAIREFYERHEIDVTAVDEALHELETLDPRQAQIVELRFFVGLTIEDIATLLQISNATVKRDWTVAKLWLRQALSQPN